MPQLLSVLENCTDIGEYFAELGNRKREGAISLSEQILSDISFYYPVFKLLIFLAI